MSLKTSIIPDDAWITRVVEHCQCRVDGSTDEGGGGALFLVLVNHLKLTNKY